MCIYIHTGASPLATVDESAYEKEEARILERMQASGVMADINTYNTRIKGIVCCSVLQCVPVGSSVLQCVPVCSGVLQCPTTHASK